MTEITVVEYNKGKLTQSQIEKEIVKKAKEMGLIQPPEFYETLISKLDRFEGTIPQDEEKKVLKKSIPLKDIIPIDNEIISNYEVSVAQCRKEKGLPNGMPTQNVDIITIDKKDDSVKVINTNNSFCVVSKNQETYTLNLSDKIDNELKDGIDKPSFDKSISEKLLKKSSIAIFSGPGMEKWVVPFVYETVKKKEIVPSKKDWFETTYNIINNPLTYSKDVFIKKLPGAIRQAEIHIGPLKHKDNGEYWTMSEIKEGGSSEKAYIVAGLLPIRNPASHYRPDVELGAVILSESEVKEILEDSKKEDLINLINLSRVVHEEMNVPESLDGTRPFEKINILYDDYFM